MTHRCRGTNSGIGIVEGGGEKGVWEYLRRDHRWSEQFPENISIISMLIIYSNVDDIYIMVKCLSVCLSRKMITSFKGL